MDQTDSNPFGASQVDATAGASDRPSRRMSLLFVIPLVTFTSAVTFCGSCFPISLVTYSALYPSPSGGGEILFFGGWVFSAAVAGWVGYLLWGWLRRVKESD